MRARQADRIETKQWITKLREIVLESVSRTLSWRIGQGDKSMKWSGQIQMAHLALLGAQRDKRGLVDQKIEGFSNIQRKEKTLKI